MKAPLVPPITPAISRYEALLRLSPGEVSLRDDMDSTSLRQAALQSLAYYKALPPQQTFVLGKDTYTALDFAGSMEYLATLIERKPDAKDWIPELLKEYWVYQSVGTDADRTVTFSSYFEPTIPARPQPDAEYRFPLYARPPDLIEVDLSLFDPVYQGARVSGRRSGRDLVPYYKRSHIDGDKVLSGTGLEIAWAKDAFDVLDLHIEGSGWLDYGQGERVRIRYDGNNGHRYRSVGLHLISTGRIPKKTFNRERLRDYLAKHPREGQKAVFVNDRYIFFRLDRSTAAPYAFGNISVPLTAGRSMATDPKLFPKGALAWIDVASQAPLQRFMLNQDEGGAIQGPGRVDIFAGSGDEALKFASQYWYKGKLYFLVKKNKMSR